MEGLNHMSPLFSSQPASQRDYTKTPFFNVYQWFVVMANLFCKSLLNKNLALEVTEKAISYCCAKVAASSGDIRQALHTLSLSVDMLLNDVVKHNKAENQAWPLQLTIPYVLKAVSHNGSFVDFLDDDYFTHFSIRK